MTRPDHIVGIDGCLFFILLMFLVSNNIVLAIERNALTHTKLKGLLSKQNKLAVKTIQSNDGEIIDCIDIYKQPAFDHPLLKDHIIEMKPSFIPDMKEGGNTSSYIMAEQTWRKYGICPEGTIPILRMTKDDIITQGHEPLNCRVETAGIRSMGEAPYHGVKGMINIWNLLVVTDEWSLTSVAAVNEQSLVECGWGVSPVMFGDSKPRFYVNWRDGTQGCYNLACPGFVQLSRIYVPGTAFDHTSTYNGDQYVIHPHIYKDEVQSKWWLFIKNEAVGYWPMKLLNNLQSASTIEWLGRVCDTEGRGYHTTTQMGSGHFASEGWRRSSFFKEYGVMTVNSTEYKAPKNWEMDRYYNGCYDSNLVAETERTVLYYGGPGGPCCDGRCH